MDGTGTASATGRRRSRSCLRDGDGGRGWGRTTGHGDRKDGEREDKVEEGDGASDEHLAGAEADSGESSLELLEGGFERGSQEEGRRGAFIRRASMHLVDGTRALLLRDLSGKLVSSTHWHGRACIDASDASGACEWRLAE